MGKGKAGGVVVAIVGIVAIVIGVIFLYEAYAKKAFLDQAVRQEKIVLGLTPEQIAKGEILDTPEELQMAGDTVRSHRREIAPTYQELLGGKKFDPTNPKHITYMQALNLENYLYLAVASYGLITVVQASGIFMILAGIAHLITGMWIYRKAS